MSDLSEEEIFEVVRKRFIESVKISPEQMEEYIQFNKDLHILTPEERFKKFTL